MLWGLERLFAPPEKIARYHRDEEAAVRHSADVEAGDPPTYRCRICKTEAPEPSFCMSCLAETMELVTDRGD